MGGAIGGLFGNVSKWIDNIFAAFNTYSKNYSRIIVWGFIILAISKVAKFKFNVNTGLPRKK